jgi:hypothetical protein
MKLKNKGIGIILAPLIIVAVLLYSHFFVDNKSPAVSVSDKAITISTQFGTTINLSDIKDIEEKARVCFVNKKCTKAPEMC